MIITPTHNHLKLCGIYYTHRSRIHMGDEYQNVKSAVVTAVYRFGRVSLANIVAFIRENRTDLSLSERDANEKTVSYVLLLLQRDQVIQRHVGSRGDFYVVDPMYVDEARRISLKYTVREVRFDDAVKCLSADANDIDDTIVAQSVLFEPPQPPHTVHIPGDVVAETQSGCVLV